MKPTTLGANLRDLQLVGLKCNHKPHGALNGRDGEGRYLITPAHTYTRLFCAALGNLFIDSIVSLDSGCKDAKG